MTLELPIEMDGRQWAVGEHAGDVFEGGSDFDGITVTIELKSTDEAKAVVARLMGDL